MTMKYQIIKIFKSFLVVQKFKVFINSIYKKYKLHAFNFTLHALNIKIMR